ncbi:MAG: hypothetical protein GX587_04065, partial [Bacteroidales bacterium]|nr:hypothetical protein [Bacteroidales bacterium]
IELTIKDGNLRLDYAQGDYPEGREWGKTNRVEYDIEHGYSVDRKDRVDLIGDIQEIINSKQFEKISGPGTYHIQKEIKALGYKWDAAKKEYVQEGFVKTADANKKEGEKDGSLSADKDRTDVRKTPEDVSAENVQGTPKEGNTEKDSVRGTGADKGDGGKLDGARSDTGTSTRNDDTGGASTRTGEGDGGKPSSVDKPKEDKPVEDKPKPKTKDKEPNPVHSVKTDYVISSQEDSIIDKGKETRYKLNVDAIKLMKQIESEMRTATPDEQKILAKYVGWGGIADVFESDTRYNPETKTYDKKGKKGWENQYNELKELLTKEEYKAAHETILNAHYTAIDVIKGMYEGLRGLGFKGGNVLEPAVGIGNFIGAMPVDLKVNTNVVTGIEIDSITGRIAKLLYPKSDIRVQGFENAKLPTAYYDVAISNVPFGKIMINDSKYPNSITRSIHNYFFAKAIDTVRPGGLVMFITSSKTMDSKDTSGIRGFINKNADFIGAIRLPNTAFKDNAMTSVTTDIIVLRVKDPGNPIKSEAFLEMAETDIPNKNGYVQKALVNEYFINHPENVLGKLMYGYNLYAGQDVYVEGTDIDLAQGIKEAFDRMPKDIMTYQQRKPSAGDVKDNSAVKDASKGTKNGSYEVVDGKLHINKDGKLVEVEKAVADIEKLSKLINIKTIARDFIEAAQGNKPETDLAKLRKQLNKIYDEFVSKYGFINNPKNLKEISDDPDVAFMKSLEVYDRDTKTATKSDIFSKTFVYAKKEAPKVTTSKEALVVALNEYGKINLDRMSELIGKSESEIVADLAGKIYKNPVTGEYETADAYLSGNVKAKLKEAEARAILDKTYEKNV